MNTILFFIDLIPVKSFLFPSGSHTVSCFSARAEIPFRLHETFSALAENPSPGIFSGAKLQPGLNPSPCNRRFDFKKICFRSQAEIGHVIRP